MQAAMPIMIQGTHSDAGKSVLVTALCRIFAQEGWKTAPFKSQNMALNSYITWDGKEIGRAQGVQAEAAYIEATTDMNPILIKPSREHEAQIVVHGEPLHTLSASAYRDEFYETGKSLIQEAYNRLSGQFDCIVIEGAGSPAEINLNDRELVNMSVARMANSPVILVGDIDKGGVFASLVGTLQLLDPQDRDRVVGVLINKFRGDKSLLAPGLEWFEQYTGKPVLGVIPYLDGLNIDAEDSLILDTYDSGLGSVDSELDIAVIRYPRISNFTDVDPLRLEHDCTVRWVSHADKLGKPDLIILPGSKNSLEDLAFLEESGLAEVIRRRALLHGTKVIGICGGYQMMGEVLSDPHGVESSMSMKQGLGLLPIRTELSKKKKTVRAEGTLNYRNQTYSVEGYEIHMGVSSATSSDFQSWIQLNEGQDGCRTDDEMLLGTYIHGIFHNDAFRHAFLNDLRMMKGLAVLNDRMVYQQVRDSAYDRLADTVKLHIQLDRVKDLMKQFYNQKETAQ